MKRIETKPIYISILLVILQSICYVTSKELSTNFHLLNSSIDERIPFIIYFIIPYVSWYFLLFISPYYLYKKDKKNFTKYCISFIIITLLANIIFICYPTTFNRTNVVGNDILSLIARLIFYIDTPVVNCFPSQHCAMSMLWILYICTSKNTSKKSKVLISIISILIMASTMFIKQHAFIDFVFGVLIAIIVFLIIRKEKKLSIKFNELFNIK